MNSREYGSRIYLVEMLEATQLCFRCGKVKNISYEIPYSVKGNIKSNGSQREPKSIYEKIILLERDKPRIHERLLCDDGIVKGNTKAYNLT